MIIQKRHAARSSFLCILASCFLGLIVVPGSFSVQAWAEDKVSPLPMRSAGAFEAAQNAIRQQHYDQAIALLEPFIADPEKYPVHVSDYIVTLYWSGNINAAIRTFELLPAAFPRRIYLLKNISQAYTDAKEYDKALVLYEDILKSEPNNIEALKGVAINLLAMGRAHDASEFLIRYQSIWDKNPWLQMYYAESLIKQGYYEKGLNLYDKLLINIRNNTEKYNIHRERTIRSLSQDKKIEAQEQIRRCFESGKQKCGEYLFLLSQIIDDSSAAIKIVNQYNLQPKNFSKELGASLAWNYFTKNKTNESLELYKSLLTRYPDFFEARLGNIYALSKSKQFVQAWHAVLELEQDYQNNLKVLYAKAYMFEQQKMFINAIHVYDRMLVLSPDNAVVKRLRIQAYSDLGAPLHALHLADASLPGDTELQHTLLGDYALNTVAWEEPEQALAIYNTILASPKPGPRYVFDAIIALTKAQRHEEAIAFYELLLPPNGKGEIPPWVQTAVAGSCLNTERPKQALALYDAALAANPVSRPALLGKIDALVELRRWKEAEAMLEKLDGSTPDYAWQGKIRHYSDSQLELDIKRGWILIYQNRLRDAEAYFQQLYEKAPGNMGIRNARAHLHRFRGLPRQAEEEFNIIKSMDPGYSAVYPGRLAVANELGDKKRARAEAVNLLSQDQGNKHMKRFVRELAVEDMAANKLESRYIAENDGSRDWTVQDELSTPLSLHTRLYGLYFLRRTWNDDADNDDEAVFFKRAGLGLTHMFSRNWSLRQQFSLGYEHADEFGTLTEVDWKPDDHWHFSGTFDSFSTDIAHRARMAGVTARKAALVARYRENEWREYSLAVSRQFFSDDNHRDEVNLGYEQDLLNRNDWRMRIFFDWFCMWNSDWDSPSIWYYNPKNVWGLSVTHMTEQTIWDAYEQYFVHRLYLTVGNWKQSDYADGVVGAIKYEQEFSFSHAQSLSWSVWYGKNLYNDDQVESLGLQAVWSMRF